MLATATSARDVEVELRGLYKLSERQARRYVAAAREEMRASASVDRAEHVAQARENYNRIIRECLALRRYGKAIQAQDSLNRLLGLNAEHTTTNMVNVFASAGTLQPRKSIAERVADLQQALEAGSNG